jgi:hypothetical protein
MIKKRNQKCGETPQMLGKNAHKVQRIFRDAQVNVSDKILDSTIVYIKA